MKYTREQGRRVTISTTPDEKMDAIREIVRDCEFAIVDGTTLDLFSASAIVKVYDALNDANKAKMASLSVPKMAKVAFGLLK